MKQQANGQKPVRDPGPHYRRRDLDPLTLVTLLGVIALLMITFTNMRSIDRLDVGLGQRLSKLEGMVAQGARPAAAPPQQGVDPTRVYTIKTGESPARGSATAAVTIAEFSDFQ